MCQLKSCLVLKDRVFCPDYNSHQSMLEELGIEDNYLHADKTFVRVEFTPPNNKSLIEPLDRWTLKVDQDVIPEWWDEKADRQRVEEAVETWRKGHVFTGGKHIVTTGTVYAYGDAEVQVYNDAMVKAHNSAKVEAYGSAKVEAFDSVTVEAYGNVTVKAYSNAKVEAYRNAKVEAFDRAVVKAYNSAMAIYPEERKIIYPTGWTAKTHE